MITEDDEEVTLSLPHDNCLLERAMQRHGVALAVIDPIMSVIGEKIDTHREREVRSALDPLAKLADRAGCVLLGIAHFNKGAGTDAASLITGSGAFKNVPRSVFGFARDDSEEGRARVLTQVKNNLGRDDLPSLAYVIETAEVETKKGVASTGKFVLTGTSDRSVADVIRENRGGPEEQDERREASGWLVDYLAGNGGEVPAKDVFKAGAGEGFSRDALKRAKGRRVVSTKAGMSGGWVWQLVLDQDPEERTKGAKSAGNETPLPSRPSALPSHPGVCRSCGAVPSDKSGIGSTGMCVPCEQRRGQT